MPDREKVIKGMNYCTHTDGTECRNCPYWHNYNCVEVLNADIQSLLKEQEAEISKISNAYLYVVGKASKQPEIVRCKDCKWRGTEACFCKAKDDVKDDWFCSEGEKAVSE